MRQKYNLLDAVCPVTSGMKLKVFQRLTLYHQSNIAVVV